MYSNVYQYYRLTTKDDGSIYGTTETNDNENLGIPGPVESWPVSYRNFASMKRNTGLSHVGCIGCVVTVSLDGKTI
jgi:hypothetical protein